MSRIRDFFVILKNTAKSWWQNEPLRTAAVVAYFAIFSIPALLVLVLNIASVFIEREKIQSEIDRQLQSAINSKTAEQIQEAVQRTGEMDEGFLPAVIGIVIILFGSTRVFVHLQTTFNNIWQVQATKSRFLAELRKALFSVGLIIVIAFLLLISMVLSAVFSAISHKLETIIPETILTLLHVLDFAVFMSLLVVLFALMFRYFPSVHLSWRDVFPGAIITALLFMLMKYGLGFYFSRSNPASVYGSAGTLVLLLLWFALVSTAVFFGAEFCRQQAHFYKKSITPSKGAHYIDSEGTGCA